MGNFTTATQKGQGEVYILFPDDFTEFYFAALDISPVYAADITASPVEDGGNINDHRYKQPISVTFTGWQSEFLNTETGVYDRDDVGPHVEFHERMLKAHENDEIIGIECGAVRGIFDGMLTNYSPNWSNNGDGYGLNFSFTVQQVRFASTKTRSLKTEAEAGKQLAILGNLGIQRVKNGTIKQMQSRTQGRGPIQLRAASDALGLQTDAAATAGDAFAAGVDWAKGP